MTHPELTRMIQADIDDCHSIVELGAGKGEQLAALKADFKLGVEIWTPYIMEWVAGDSQHVVADVPWWLNREKHNEFDALLFIDVLEHMEKTMAVIALGAAMDVARKKIVVFTPLGFMNQEPEDGNPFQRHLSGWAPEEFLEMGFDVSVLKLIKACHHIYAVWRKDDA